MKNRIFLFPFFTGLMVLILDLVPVKCEGQATQFVNDSINVFYDSLFYHLRHSYLLKDEVNWDSLEQNIRNKALERQHFEKSLQVTTELFDAIKGSHMNLFSEKGWYKSTLMPEIPQSEFNIKFLEKYAENPSFETRVLDDSYGYVLMPGMLLIDVSQDSINKVAQNMYDQIIEMHKSNSLKGWIIDLRFNIGGNVFPMLSSLYHLLGNTVTYTVKNRNGQLKEEYLLQNGNIKDEESGGASVQPKTPPNQNIPVALIVGRLTASAGELIPLSFRVRQNVLVVGEKSYGLLTANTLTELPFSTKLTLTSGYLADRSGTYTERIVPDIEVIKEANFEDLLKDQNVIEAIKFIKSKNESN
ncbi:S41 family peptidase [Xanthovirga aplysinae]|uniref:S41 family peptidase n=1 Tax=Xanthovirga aplysinae TaxID=2529853 RepID=UPI0012BBB846|nr:S41 family peptidase [Xanthovirga aplysinae]MTI29390.1 hypothetical protein [Xanthovirga aplysinae]